MYVYAIYSLACVNSRGGGYPWPSGAMLACAGGGGVWYDSGGGGGKYWTGYARACWSGGAGLM